MICTFVMFLFLSFFVTTLLDILQPFVKLLYTFFIKTGQGSKEDQFIICTTFSHSHVFVMFGTCAFFCLRKAWVLENILKAVHIALMLSSQTCKIPLTPLTKNKSLGQTFCWQQCGLSFFVFDCDTLKKNLESCMLK